MGIGLLSLILVVIVAEAVAFVETTRTLIVGIDDKGLGAELLGYGLASLRRIEQQIAPQSATLSLGRFLFKNRGAQPIDRPSRGCSSRDNLSGESRTAKERSGVGRSCC